MNTNPRAVLELEVVGSNVGTDRDVVSGSKDCPRPESGIVVNPDAKAVNLYQYRLPGVRFSR